MGFAKVPAKPAPCEPMLAAACTDAEAQAMIHDDAYVMQQKHDGQRLIVEGMGPNAPVLAWSRTGKPVATDFADWPKGLILDGELMPKGPLYAFDVLALPEYGSTLSWSYVQRTDRLRSLDLPNVVMTRTHDGPYKSHWFNVYLKLEAEGVVFKLKSDRYRPGKRDWYKFKFTKSCTCVVLAQNVQRSVAVGLTENGAVIPVGDVSIPVNKSVPDVGELVEVRYLYRTDSGKLYQPVYLGIRTDVNCDTTEDAR